MCRPRVTLKNGTKSPIAPETFRPNSFMYVGVAEDMGRALLQFYVFAVYHGIGRHMVDLKTW